MIFVHLGLKYDYDLIKIRSMANELNYVFYTVAPQRNFLFRLGTSRKTKWLFNCFPKDFFASFYLTKRIRKICTAADEKICFIINEISPIFLDVCLPEYLRRTFPGCYVVFSLEDRVSLLLKCLRTDDFNSFASLFDCVLSYNEVDSVNYPIVHSRPRISDLRTLFRRDKHVLYDVFFVGRSKGRIEKILNVYDALKAKGLKCCFYVVGVPKNYSARYKDVVFNRRISYRHVIRKIQQSKAILNIVQDGVVGISLRDYEAIAFDKKIITNNRSITSYSFYNPHMVLFLDRIMDVDLASFLNSDHKWNSPDGYSPEKWYEWLENKLVAN